MRDRDGVPVAFDKDVDQVIPQRVLTAWKPTGRSAPLSRSLTVGERGAVEARAAALELALAPFEEKGRARVESAVAAMFNGFRAMRQQGEDVANTVMVTVSVLAAFPAWAIERACLKIARNEAGLDRRFAANDPEIAEVVREILRPYKDKLGQATQLLSGSLEAPVPMMSRAHNPSYQELQERCAKDGLMIGNTRPDQAKAAEEFRASTGISQEEFDAIPNS